MLRNFSRADMAGKCCVRFCRRDSKLEITFDVADAALWFLHHSTNEGEHQLLRVFDDNRAAIENTERKNANQKQTFIPLRRRRF